MTATLAQSNRRRIRLMLRQREPELAGRLNRAVRTLPCGPGCRLHATGPVSRDQAHPVLTPSGDSHA